MLTPLERWVEEEAVNLSMDPPNWGPKAWVNKNIFSWCLKADNDAARLSSLRRAFLQASPLHLNPTTTLWGYAER